MAEGERHQALLLSGLSGNIGMLDRATRHWEKDGVDVTVHDFEWKDDTIDLETKLQQVSEIIKELSEKGPVSLIGTSAGGSAAFNAFLENSELVNKAISICGRLREGEQELEKKSKDSEKFRASVLRFEGKEADIPEELRKRMLTTSARYGDQHVPADTSYVKDVQHIKVRSAEHSITIGVTLYALKNKLINFIKLTEEETER